VEEGKRDSLMKQLGEVEEWIYGDGENAQKGVYVSKLEELKEQGGPVEALYREWESIPHEVGLV
jgi:heat shock protein 4